MRSVQYLNLDINKKTQQVITANVGEIGSRYVKIKYRIYCYLKSNFE